VATAAVIGTVAATGCCTDVVPPVIQIIEDPPEPPVVSRTVAEAILLGEWTASQAYDVEGERAWITGTLTFDGDSYTFTHSQGTTGTSVQGELDFLFDNPSGEVTIEYAEGVQGDAYLESFAPDHTIATCVFRAGSTVLGEFLIKVRDFDSVYLYAPSSEDGLWSVTK
jgi:hypothetical protein